MKNFQELLTGTTGIARLAAAYTDQVQCRKVDGSDVGLTIATDVRVFCYHTKSGAPDVTIERDSNSIELNGTATRALFGALHGILASEYDEDIVPPSSREQVDLGHAIKLLRTVRAEHPEAFVGVDSSSVDILLARYPDPVTP